jgi:hypothetical protein
VPLLLLPSLPAVLLPLPPPLLLLLGLLFPATPNKSCSLQDKSMTNKSIRGYNVTTQRHFICIDKHKLKSDCWQYNPLQPDQTLHATAELRQCKLR